MSANTIGLIKMSTFVFGCGFSKLMQRIFKHGGVQNTDLTSDKKLNI